MPLRTSRSGGSVLGTMLVVSGLVFLVNNFRFHLPMAQLWPIFPLSLGIAMYIEFAQWRENYSLLMPATVITVSGAVLLYCAIVGWAHMAELWPVLLLGLAAGSFLNFVFGEHHRGLLIAAAVFAVGGILFLFPDTRWKELWPLVLILVGCAMVFRRKSRG